MDAPDRLDQTLPSPLFATTPLAKTTHIGWEDGGEPAAPQAPKTLTLKIALRAARRHWWQILGLWILGSLVFVPVIYKYVKPSYDAFALLRIEATNRSLIANVYDQSSSQGQTYLETQVQLITNPDVLSAALQMPRIASLPRFRSSPDAENELRKALRVAIIPKTNLISITMSSESATESATVVNAVLNSYLTRSSFWTDEETGMEITRLKELKTEFSRQVDDHRKTLGELANKAGADTGLESEKEKISIDQYRTLNARLSEVSLERLKTEETLTYLKQIAQREGSGEKLAGAQLDAAARAKFLMTPAAERLADQINEAEETLEKAQRVTAAARRSREPVIKRAESELTALRQQWQQLWEKMEPQVKAAIAEARPGTMGDQIERMATHLQELKTDEKLQRAHLEKAKIANRGDNDGVAMQMRFTEIDLNRASEMLGAVERNLNQLEYESRRSTRTSRIVEAKPPGKPSSDHRLKLMAAMPLIWLAGLMGLFVLLEVKSGRVADPDDLPMRVNVGVIGVVPPLPTLRSPRGIRSARNERRRVEEFVQSLDHLRVTLCSGMPGLGGRRCVLITSATGGEGKTTLAAQLAGRCANAGLLTLLVDADLRRPSLGELLEVPEGPGLADVLADEATPEDAMVVIGNAGGFHLLPAGSPSGDPSRLLQGERLGHLIARFRETFDVVIVDAPPVLAVPDALILGRWVDGAVLAVRHDTSRFPLVERANRRLASIGIPVLGAVVNGVRPMEATYGTYSYSATGADDEDGPPVG